MMKILRGIDSALLKIQNLILVFSTAIIILFMCTGVVCAVRFDGYGKPFIISAKSKKSQSP